MNKIKEFYARPMSDREIKARAAMMAYTGLAVGAAWLAGQPEIAEFVAWVFVFFCALAAVRVWCSAGKRSVRKSRKDP